MKPNQKILNIFTAFFSALLGILIAFRLEFYREEQQEQEQLDKALIVIKEELENNLEIYETNSDQICQWLKDLSGRGPPDLPPLKCFFQP